MKAKTRANTRELHMCEHLELIVEWSKCIKENKKKKSVKWSKQTNTYESSDKRETVDECEEMEIVVDIR